MTKQTYTVSETKTKEEERKYIFETWTKKMTKQTYNVIEGVKKEEVTKQNSKTKQFKFHCIKANGLGLICGNISSFFIVCTEILIKMLSDDISSTEIVFIMYALPGVLLVPYFTYVYFHRHIVKHSLKKWLMIIPTSASLVLAVYLNCFALRYMSVLDTAVVTNSRTAIVAAMAFLILKEAVGCYDLVNVVMSITGVILVCQPTFIFGPRDGTPEQNDNRYLGAIFGIASAFSSSIYNLLVRRLQGVDSLLITALQPFVSCVLGGFIIFAHYGDLHIPSNTRDTLLLIGVSSFHATAIILLTISMKYAEAAPLSVMLTIQIPYGFVMQWAILSTLPTSYAIGGLVLGLSSSILVAGKPYVFRIYRKICKRDEVEEDETATVHVVSVNSTAYASTDN
ncbi:Uncharacterised protein g2567 [Pycnogonum litorale]